MVPILTSSWTHDSQAKIDHIISFRATISTQIRVQLYASGRGLNESRCSQPERDTGRSVNWLQSYSLGNENQYDEPTVSSVYMAWMADWVQVEEWDLAARKGTPLSSTAIDFHYNTPLKPAAHNHTWNLIRGGGEIATIHQRHYSELSAMSALCAHCIQRCKSLAIWFMLM